MRALQVKEPYEMEIVDLPRPELGPGQVRVRVRQVGVCGTDLSLVTGKLPFARYPIVPGHELAGEIIEVGPSSEFEVGDRVTANPILHCGHCAACQAGNVHYCEDTAVLGVVNRNGAFAEEVVLDDDMIWVLPDDLNFEEGAMAEPAVIADRTVRRGSVQPGDTVAVLGAGNIGLLLIQVARIMGAAKVMVTDLLEYRLDIARTIGVDLALDVAKDDLVQAGREAFGGFDVMIDGVGLQETIVQGIQLCKPGGRIVVYGVPQGGDLAIPVLDGFRKDLTIHTSRLYPRSFAAGLELLQSGQLALEPMITTRVSLGEAPQVLRDLSEKRGKMVKILIHTQEE
jgi:2-desacetyl-2-hydroxyethyl bacteriochlorophyllide A dehydrogenase